MIRSSSISLFLALSFLLASGPSQNKDPEAQKEREEHLKRTEDLKTEMEKKRSELDVRVQKALKGISKNDLLGDKGVKKNGSFDPLSFEMKMRSKSRRMERRKNGAINNMIGSNIDPIIHDRYQRERNHVSDHVGSVPTGNNIISIFQLGQDGSNLNRDTRDSLDNVHATVVDHVGNPMVDATVYFFSTERDTVISVSTDSLGTVSSFLESGLWSAYAHNNTDNGTYIDLWDGGVFQVIPEGTVNEIELVLQPRDQYGFLIAGVRENTEEDTLGPVITSVVIEDSTDNAIYWGTTNVWGDIGTALAPYQEYDVIIYYDGEYHEQSIYIDTTDSYYSLMFEFGEPGDMDTTTLGVEFYFSSIDSMYAEYEEAFSSMGAGCDGC
ncbi:MAG: hypothetical protein QF780_00530, partial [Candidatus Marinimicrobia bacterium]|nr:hypothetical protein [Candidatus Neomarinimicrobiota bacterium]